MVAMAVGETPEAREESDGIGVPYVLLGNNLAQSRAMHLANACLERSQCLASRDRLLSVPQIDLSACADRKMVIFMSICIISQRNHEYRTDTQTKKIVVRTKNLRTPSYAYLRICIFSKEITALQVGVL